MTRKYLSLPQAAFLFLGAMLSLVFVACGGGTIPADESGADTPLLEVLETAVPTPLAITTGSRETDAKGLPVGFTADGFPYRGNPEAPVLIEEFSDYQCPFCSRFAAQTLPALEENQIANGEAVLVFYDFPLTNIHPQAMAAHNAAHCAGDQGAAAYWNMHDLLFANLNEWGNRSASDFFTNYATELGLDMDAFATCLAEETHVARIEASISLGTARGVQSTPSFFINERPLIGAQPLSTFNSTIAAALAGEPAAVANEPASADTAVAYPTPAPAVVDLSLAAATLGDPNAPTTIIEFSDYQCPYCQRHAAQTLPTLITEMIDSGRVYYAYMDFPLDNIHPEARSAAAAARCAGAQNAYWEMHDALFANVESWSGQGSAAAAVYANLAESLGLDTTAFTACVESGEFDTAVEDSFTAGLQLGINSTPSFLINGYPMAGAQPFDTFVQVIDLAEQGQLGQVIADQQRRAEEAAAQEAAQQAPPEPVDVPIGDAFIIGSPDALVTIVEYTDFQCPFCQRHALQTLPAIVQQYVDEGVVRYVFKDFPLTSIHPQAVKAAEAARCALEQDAFLPMHETLFTRQQEWAGQDDAAEMFISFASDLGLETAAFETCLNSNRYEAAVMADLDEGIQLGINGTPAFFINGYFISGAQPIELFDNAVQFFIDEAANNN